VIEIEVNSPTYDEEDIEEVEVMPVARVEILPVVREEVLPVVRKEVVPGEVEEVDTFDVLLKDSS